MASNVGCAGAPAEHYPDGVERCPGWPPCGWKGERFGFAQPMWLAGQPATYTRDRLNPAWVDLVTRKPCPRCGGRVELLPTTAGTTAGTGAGAVTP